MNNHVSNELARSVKELVDVIRARLEPQSGPVAEPADDADHNPHSDFEGPELLGMIVDALDIAWRYGGIQGEHHKTWVIDQMVRVLTGDGYQLWVRTYEYDDEHQWEEGVAP